ncbi:MAG TPA: NAD-dependent epimerase/dehydratase family protein [Hyphomonadaceae bacterium]|nr:NAD-dependent epimerase/dehydratase family protein [Hyphomonadaceae bacterium]
MNDNVPEAPTCLLTGASGYLGGLIAKRLKAAGWRVVGMTRKPRAGEVAFTLGQPVSPEILKGHDALIHCAYDFAPIGWTDIEATNIKGAEMLFAAAKAAGIKRMVAISTISAFDGCKSNYGKAKLEIEKHARTAGACIVRPGLIYGAAPGAMFGRLVSQVKKASLVPIPGDGKQLMYTVHEDDLTDAILNGLSTNPAPQASITVANGVALSFRDIMVAIGRKLNRSVTTIPVPWQAMWLALRTAEVAKIPLGLRSDSLVSLVNQDKSPVINSDLLGVRCRSFSLDGVAIG